MANPKSPHTDPEKLDAFLERFGGDSKDFFLFIKLANLGRMRRKKELSDAAISFELLSIILEQIEGGQISLEDWNCLVENNDEMISIPLRHIKPLADGWTRYTSGEKGLELNEALNIGSSGQGRSLAKTVIKHRRDFRTAFWIEFSRSQSADRGQAMSIEKTIDEFAEKSGTSRSQLKRAYYARIDDVRAVNEILGFPIILPE